MLFLRQSTAGQEILLGPFVDSTDGVTAETGLTIANTDIKLWVDGATTEANKTSGGATHIASGRYYAVLDATDTATVGKMEVNVAVAGALPVRREYHVLEEVIYDSLFAASAAGYQVPIWAAAGSTVNLSATTIKTATDVETDTADIQSRLPAALVSGRIDSSVGAMAANVLTASALATDAVAEIADGVWDEAQAGHVTVGSFGITASEIADILVDTAEIGAAGAGLTNINLPNQTMDITGNLSGSVGSVTGAVGSVTGAVGSVTGAVGSVTGAVGSVTGNVGGNVVGSVGSVTGAVGSVTGAVGSVAGAVGSVTGNVGGNVVGSVASVTAIAANAVNASALASDAVTEIATGVLTTAMTESYNADGAAPTLAQALMVIMQVLTESSVASTTMSVKRLDGTTTALTLTLNDATTPTSITRAT